MAHIPAALHKLVVERATDRCEYCKLAQAGQEATFHVDHIVPLKAGGETSSENLAWACVSCSLHKAARRGVHDPESGTLAPLFHPRQDNWLEHFSWEGVHVTRLTPTGRATVAALHMNRSLVLAIRAEETLRGRHPPAETS